MVRAACAQNCAPQIQVSDLSQLLSCIKGHATANLARTYLACTEFAIRRLPRNSACPKPELRSPFIYVFSTLGVQKERYTLCKMH